MDIPTAQQAAKTLWDLLKRDNCVAWVGSGLSKIAGYPDWEKTIAELCRACNVQELVRSNKKATPELLIAKAQDCKESNPYAYTRCLADLFGQRVVAKRHAYDLLMKLPFRAYITTNFDPLLSTAGCDHGYNDLYCYPELDRATMGSAKKPIYYIHGLARRGDRPCGENLVLARSDFENAYHEDGLLRPFLDPLLTLNDIVFISCGLEEPEMQDVFARVSRIQARISRQVKGACLPKRCAIAHWQKEETAPEVEPNKESLAYRQQKQDQRYREMNIEVIRYCASDDRHEKLEEILEALCELADTRVSPRPKSILS